MLNPSASRRPVDNDNARTHARWRSGFSPSSRNSLFLPAWLSGRAALWSMARAGKTFVLVTAHDGIRGALDEDTIRRAPLNQTLGSHFSTRPTERAVQRSTTAVGARRVA